MFVSTAEEAVYRELKRATTKHPVGFHSAHEGYAVILEELDELWDEVKAQHPSPDNLRKEATHVAAMALRFLIDICEEEKP